MRAKNRFRLGLIYGLTLAGIATGTAALFVWITDNDPLPTIAFIWWQVFILTFLLVSPLCFISGIDVFNVEYIVGEEWVLIRGDRDCAGDVDIQIRRGEVAQISDRLFSWEITLHQGGIFRIPKYRVGRDAIAKCLGCEVR